MTVYNSLSSQPWTRAMQQVARDSVAHLPGTLDAASLSLLLEAMRRLDYEAVVQGTEHLVQLSYLASKLNGEAAIRRHPILSIFNRELGAVVRQSLPDTGLQTWQANSIVAQTYRDAGDFISAHRDYKPDRGVIVVCTLAGEADFQVLEDRGEDITFTCHTEPGSIVILRAPGMMNPYFDFHRRQDGWCDPSDDVRPYHRALSPTVAPRVTLTFRMVLRDV
jgi:hypothetical protein